MLARVRRTTQQTRFPILIVCCGGSPQVIEPNIKGANLPEARTVIYTQKAESFITKAKENARSVRG